MILPGLGIDHKVNRNELLLMSKLKTNDKGAKILSFTLVTVDNNFRSRELESDSETITLEMKQAIRDAGSSERMIIKDVKVKQEREIFFLEPVTFFISE